MTAMPTAAPAATVPPKVQASSLPLTFPVDPGNALGGFIRGKDQRFYVIGTGNEIWVRGLTDPGWSLIPNSSGVVAVNAEPRYNQLFGVTKAGGAVVSKGAYGMISPIDDSVPWANDLGKPYANDNGDVLAAIDMAGYASYALKPDGLLYKKVYQGTTPTWVNVPGGANMKQISVTSNNIIYVTVTDGTVWKSMDSGITWTQLQYAGVRAAIVNPKTGALYLIDGGGLLRTT